MVSVDLLVGLPGSMRPVERCQHRKTRQQAGRNHQYSEVPFTVWPLPNYRFRDHPTSYKYHHDFGTFRILPMNDEDVAHPNEVK
jgi:hypothetical protein